MTWEDLRDESTLDLIDYIRSINDPGYYELGEAAFIAFTFKFRTDLIDKCVVLCRKWGLSEDDGIELVRRVFARFLKYPRFESSKCSSGKIDECLKRYLYGIANKEIVTLLHPIYYPFDGTESLVASLIDAQQVYEPEKLKKLQAYEAWLDELFSRLTPKHKIIFLTYKQYELQNRTLPRHLLADMRNVLGLTQNTIRVYKMEAIALVNKELKNG